MILLGLVLFAIAAALGVELVVANRSMPAEQGKVELVMWNFHQWMHPWALFVIGAAVLLLGVIGYAFMQAGIRRRLRRRRQRKAEAAQLEQARRDEESVPAAMGTVGAVGAVGAAGTVGTVPAADIPAVGPPGFVGAPGHEPNGETLAYRGAPEPAGSADDATRAYGAPRESRAYGGYYEREPTPAPTQSEAAHPAQAAEAADPGQTPTGQAPTDQTRADGDAGQRSTQAHPETPVPGAADRTQQFARLDLAAAGAAGAAESAAHESDETRDAGTMPQTGGGVGAGSEQEPVPPGPPAGEVPSYRSTTNDDEATQAMPVARSAEPGHPGFPAETDRQLGLGAYAQPAETQPAQQPESARPVQQPVKPGPQGTGHGAAPSTDGQTQAMPAHGAAGDEPVSGPAPGQPGQPDARSGQASGWPTAGAATAGEQGAGGYLPPPLAGHEQRPYRSPGFGDGNVREDLMHDQAPPSAYQPPQSQPVPYTDNPYQPPPEPAPSAQQPDPAPPAAAPPAAAPPAPPGGAHRPHGPGAPVDDEMTADDLGPDDGVHPR